MAAAATGDPAATADGSSLDVRYGIEFDLESVPRLCAEHGLAFPS
jgi:hypothetical protein